MCPQFVASCWPLLCLDHSPDNRVTNSHGEIIWRTVPKGFILLTEFEVMLCLEMLEKLGLPVDLVLLILKVVAGLVQASWASSVSSISNLQTVSGEYADKLLVVVLTKRASRLPRNSSAAASIDKVRPVFSSLCIWLMFHFKVYPFSGSWYCWVWTAVVQS